VNAASMFLGPTLLITTVSAQTPDDDIQLFRKDVRSLRKQIIAPTFNSLIVKPNSSGRFMVVIHPRRSRSWTRSFPVGRLRRGGLGEIRGRSVADSRRAARTLELTLHGRLERRRRAVR
jgi:hypothetical protein